MTASPLNAEAARALSKKGELQVLEERNIAQKKRYEQELERKRYLMETTVPRLESDILQEVANTAENTGGEGSKHKYR